MKFQLSKLLNIRISKLVRNAIFPLVLILTFIGCTDSGTNPTPNPPDDADIDISLTNYDFGPVRVGFTKYWEMKIRNTGELPLSVTRIALDDTSSIFTVDFDNGTGEQIGGGNELLVEIAFTPETADLSYSANMTISSSDQDESELTVSLTGTGSAIGLPDLVVSDTTYDFGAVDVGESETFVLILQNTGSDTLFISSIDDDLGNQNVLSTNFNNNTGAALLVNQQMSVVVTYSPLDNDGLDATLTINSNDPDTPRFTVRLTGSGSSYTYSGFVQPIFNRSCIACHGGQGGLFLDTYENLMQGGDHGPAVEPGNADESRLIEQLEGDETPQMPLGQAPLPAEEINGIRAWINAGALNN